MRSLFFALVMLFGLASSSAQSTDPLRCDWLRSIKSLLPGALIQQGIADDKAWADYVASWAERDAALAALSAVPFSDTAGRAAAQIKYDAALQRTTQLRAIYDREHAWLLQLRQVRDVVEAEFVQLGC